MLEAGWLDQKIDLLVRSIRQDASPKFATPFIIRQILITIAIYCVNLKDRKTINGC